MGRLLVALIVALSTLHGENTQAGVLRPPAREHYAIAYDPAGKRVIVFGGLKSRFSDPTPFPLDDLWSWDGRAWQQIALHTGLNITGHVLFADTAGRVFVSGGDLGLTARLNGQRWATVSVDTNRALAAPAGAFDSRRKRYVSVGGSRRPGVMSADTWEFDGERWTRLATSGPPAMMEASMVYDEHRAKMVLFGGMSAAANGPWPKRGETWEWDGRSWQRAATSGPPARAGAGMVYDSRRKMTVLFGGSDANNKDLGDTWLWNGTAWQRAATSGPPARMESFMAFDAARGVTVLFGGTSQTVPNLDDTWEWDGTTWRNVLAKSTAPARP